MTIDQAKQLAKDTLSPKRYQHTENVAQAAKRLALRWGADPQKAELAGWLHDIVKEKRRDELLQILNGDAIMARSTLPRPVPVWHGPAAAVYAKQTLGVDDETVLSAIAAHTTGKPGMNTLDKVVFLADMVSEERTMDSVGDIRRLAYEDLDAAVVATMRQNIEYLKAVGKPLDTETVAALNYLAGN